MAVNYGTSSTLEPLSYTNIGQLKPIENETKKDSSWTDFLFSSTFLKGMIIVLELGLSFFPPKRLATESAKLLYQIGLGIVSAAGTTTVDALNNNLSVATIAIDFGTAFIPFATHKLKQAHNLRKVKKGVARLVSEKDEFIKGVEVGKEAVEKKFSEAIARQLDTVGKVNEPFVKWNKHFLEFMGKPYYESPFKNLKSIYLKDYKKFLKFVSDPKWIKNDAVLLNMIAPKGALRQAKKEFPGLFETILHKSKRDARWNHNLKIWQNMRFTGQSKYSQANSYELQELLQEPLFTARQAKLEKVCDKIDELLKAKNTTLKKLSQRIDDYQQMIFDLQNIGKEVLSSKQVFTKAIGEISKDNKLNELAVKYIIYSKKKLRISEAAAKSNEVIREVVKKLKDKPQQKEAFESLISLIKNVKENPELGIRGGLEQIEDFLEPLLKSFDSDTLVFIHKLNNAKSTWRATPTQFQEVVDFLSSNLKAATDTIERPSKFKSFIKYLGSARFDDKVVQRVQNIFDPRDAGRYGVERIYRKINQIVQNKINSFAEKKIVNEAIEGATKNVAKLGASDDVADAVVEFEKQSIKITTKTLKGVTKTTTRTNNFRMTHRVPSKYLSHYQIFGKKGIYYIVWMHFVKKFHKTGRNKHGKKPIWITATREELYNIKTIGGTYFKSIAYKRGWEQSRGGRRHSNKSYFGNRDLSLFLSLVPINPLRRTLSLVSNIVEGSYSMATGSFFTRQWVEKFTTSFANTLKNRVGRLLTRTGTKYFANKYRLAALQKLKKSAKEYRLAIQKTQSKINFLARNVQKTGSLLLNNLRFTYDNSGQFYFKSKNYGRKTYNQLFRSYLPTSGRSLLIHKSAARRRNSIIRKRLQGLSPKELAIFSEKQKNISRQLISGRRKLSQVGRIRSAVTPNALFSKSFRGLTRFKI